jgi:hypothetical protein
MIKTCWLSATISSIYSKLPPYFEPIHSNRNPCHGERDPLNMAIYFCLLSLAPQPRLGLGLLHKIRLNFLEASQHFLFYRVWLLAPRPTPITGDQVSVFIFPRGSVATHFSRLLRHARVTMGLFLFPGLYYI